MIVDLKGYRVFIASPGGLQAERKAFRDALFEFNDAHAVQKGAIFLPVGWEDTPGGMGRAQEQINEQVRTCDYCVILFHNWWGMPPAQDGVFGSGTEEEFDVAVKCKKDPEMPMRNVVVFFKGVDAVQLGDPGPQLLKVLEFKKKLEEERGHLFKTYDDVGSFEQKLGRLLGEWLREHEGAPPMAEPRPAYEEAPRTAPVPAGADRAPTDEQNALEEAWRLAGAGRRTDAEAVFAQEVVGGGSAAAYLEYGRFLRLDGRLNQAMTMVTKALDLAGAQGRRALEADAHLELGMLLDAQDTVGRAEASFRTALDLYIELHRNEGIADSKRSIGQLLVRRGELDEAETMYRAALAIDERLGRRGGMADDYSYIGSALQARGDLAGAEEMHQAALEIDRELQRFEAVAKHYGDLGSVRYTRGDWAGAEEMYREALKLDESLGRLDAMADDYSNIGNVLAARGDLDGAEEMHREAVDIDARLERFEGLADHYENLAVIEETRGRRDQAEALREQSRAARQRSEGT